MATTLAVKAFREAYVSADVLDSRDFSKFDSRRLRYMIYWSFYENTAYRNIHTWAQSYRNQYGLYRYIRNIYNPTYRLGEFWKSMLLGGVLDDRSGEAGEEGAIPIATENDRLRAPISRLWGESNWNVNKDIVSLYGAVLGDVGIKIIDDTRREIVRLEVVHPGTIEDVTVDAMGFVKGYKLAETREDPEKEGRWVKYTEICERGEGDGVTFKTYKDGKPYAWNGELAEWEEPYGFVPFIAVQHNNVGLDWGWAELHPLRSKIHEVDDLASKLDDQIRKAIDPVWLFSGVKKPASTPQTTGTTATSDRPEPGREEMPAFYADKDAKAQALIGEVKIQESFEVLKGILSEIERDYPELQMDIWTAGGDTSGKALRIARQRAEIKVLQRRANYDDAMVRAHQMAIAIGGFRGYEGYDGFDLGSYDRGDLDHVIDERPVFAIDLIDKLETDKMFWEAAKASQDAGGTLVGFLKEQGWEDQRINDFLEVRAAEVPEQ